MKGKHHLLALFLFLIVYRVASQSLIHGSVRGDDSTGISFANVLLLQPLDSRMIQGSVTDENGNFSLTGIQQGVYSLEVSRIGYSKFFIPTLHVSGSGKLILQAITLNEDVNELNEVTVKANKPLYELEQGKMVINVQSSITSAGLSAIDLLERSPGVFVNRQNNSFSLSGKDGVIVLMNGKRSRMPMEALYQMLAGLNAGDIEKIEIMTVPPANYDSDGDAGLVNIVLKRSSDMVGTNATLTTGLGYGSGPQANLSLNLNHQGSKLNWFGNYSINYLEQFQIIENFRESSNYLESVSTSNVADRNTDRTAHNYQFGIDYMIAKNTILSGLMSGYSNQFQLTAPTISFLDYSTSPDTLIELTTVDKNQWKHMMGNINLHHVYKNGQVFNANLDYLTYQNLNPSHYRNGYYSDKGAFFRNEENRMSKDTPITIWVAKVDHSISIGKSILLESGIKGTFSNLINHVRFETKKGDSWIRNPAFSNFADLKENILAAFTSIKIELDTNTTINAGIRYEHTITNLETLEEGKVVDRNYGDFFPSLFLSRKLNENNLVLFSYGRRITRPTFNEMAPLAVFWDLYTFFAGNINILPAFTHNIKGDYSYKSLIFSLQYSLDKDVILRYQPHIDPETNKLFFIPENIDRRHTLAATVTIPFKVTEWWEIQNNLTANREKIDTELHGEIYQVAQNGFQLNSTQTFKLPENYKLELAGNYVSPIINGYFNWLSRGFVNLGIQKEFNYGGVFRLSCNDIFETNIVRWKSFDDARVSINGRGKLDTRRFILTYTHNFGNSKIKGTRKRTVGSQEEQNRVTN